MHRSRRVWIAAIVAVVVLIAGITTLSLDRTDAGAASVTPGADPFYTPPSPLPPGAMGDVLRFRSSKFTLDPIFNVPVLGVRAWQILYRSSNAAGTPIAVSGTVLVPTTPWFGPGSRPLVSYGVGTRGIGDSCAPSYTLSKGTDYEGLFINSLLSRGWAVAVSDMEGLGTPGQHTYEVGQSQGRAALDIARAAERLTGTGLGATTPVGVKGYSQGGTTAGWAAELAPTYAPELNLKGVAASGVPADLTEVARFLDGGPGVALALLAAAGYGAAYPDLNLAGSLNATGTQLLKDMKDLCLVSVDGVKGLLGTAFHHLDDYTAAPNLLSSPSWQRRLNQNKLGTGKPTVPVFQAHALVDELVAYGQADTLHKTWCAKGVNLTWKVYPVAEHALGLVESDGAAVTFLADRFAGKPVSASC